MWVEINLGIRTRLQGLSRVVRPLWVEICVVEILKYPGINTAILSRVVRPLWVEIIDAAGVIDVVMSRVVRPLWVEIQYTHK